MSLPNYNVYDDLNKRIPPEYKIKDYYFKVNNNTSIMENQKIFGTSYYLYSDIQQGVEFVNSMRRLLFV